MIEPSAVDRLRPVLVLKLFEGPGDGSDTMEPAIFELEDLTVGQADLFALIRIELRLKQLIDTLGSRRKVSVFGTPEDKFLVKAAERPGVTFFPHSCHPYLKGGRGQRREGWRQTGRPDPATLNSIPCLQSRLTVNSGMTAGTECQEIIEPLEVLAVIADVMNLQRTGRAAGRAAPAPAFDSFNP